LSKLKKIAFDNSLKGYIDNICNEESNELFKSNKYSDYVFDAINDKLMRDYGTSILDLTDAFDDSINEIKNILNQEIIHLDGKKMTDETIENIFVNLDSELKDKSNEIDEEED
jgi:hypothetical protein